MPPRPNISRPARHRAGKPVASESSSDDSDAGSEYEGSPHPPESAKPSSQPAKPSAASFPSKIGFTSRKQVDESEFVTESEGSSEDSEDGSGNDSGDSSSGSDSSSSEDERPVAKPVFMSKAKRDRIAAAAAKKGDKAESSEREEREIERRKREEADQMLKSHLEKQALREAEQSRYWDDDEGQDAEDIDDTDDIDPEAEYTDWKLREFLRLKREREELIASEKEREEVERRRNLSKEEREREDDEFLAKQADERDAKGKMGFMQKYFHKGAFFAGDSAETRDIMGARYVDDVHDREMLPEYMKIRDMTKLGRKGRTRYRDLKTEDTGQWGNYDTRTVGDPITMGNGANLVPVSERKRYGEQDNESSSKKGRHE